MKFGGLNFGGKLGGWNLINHSATRLPEDLASVELVNIGAKFEPIWLLASQIVNGINYMLVCEVTRTTLHQNKSIAVVVVNIPAGSIGGKGATIREVIQDVDLVEGVPDDIPLEEYFQKALGNLTGVSYKPVMYVGSKITKGVNYSIIAEAQLIYPNSEPYAVAVEINVFQDEVSVVDIKKL